jgi:hypothetical protein
MTFHSGKGGTALINATELPITDWSVDPTTEIVNFRNSKTGNYSKKESTFKDCDFSITLDHDFDANPFAAPLALVPGQTLTNVKLVLNGGSVGTSFWLFPSAIVKGTPQTLEIEGKIKTVINCTADGTWTSPV